MEEEYRMLKAQSDIQFSAGASDVIIHEDGAAVPVRDSLVSEGTTLATGGLEGADDDASTRGVVSPASRRASNSKDLNAEGEIPTIRISTESNREKKAEMEKEIEASENSEVKTNGVNGGTELQPPVQAAAGEGEQDGSESPGTSAPEPFSFSNKRLCERWLDNLFMVLYEVTQRCSVSLMRSG